MNNNYIPLITNISLQLNKEINIKPNNNNSPNLYSLNKYINSNNLNNSYKIKKNSLNLEETIGNFILGKSLGKGTFGKVKIGTHKITGEKVAIKILLKEKLIDNIDKTRMMREIKILKNTFHFNIIKIYEVIETETSIYLIMELSEKGELFNYIIQNKRLNELESLKFFHQIIDAVDYMHKLGICHRDLKPENMLLDFQNNLKIIDFGLSNLYVMNELLQTPCGSPGYASPEMIKGDKYNGYKSDIWSCGIILYVMLCGYLPFDDETEQKLFEKIIKGKFNLPNFLSNEVKDLLKLILNTNPYKRIDINGIRKHAWYNKFNYEIIDGLFVSCMNIPVDNYIINELKKYGKNEENVKKDVIKNYHNDNTTSYYLLVKKNSKKGIESISDLYSKKFSDYIKKFRFIYFPLKNINNNNKIHEDYHNNIFNNNNNYKKKIKNKNKSFDKNENEKNYNLKSYNNNNKNNYEYYDKYINLTDNVITNSNIDIENDFREKTNFDNNSKNVSKNKNNNKNNNNNNKILNFEKILNKKKHFLNFNLITIKTQLKSNYENYIKKNKKNVLKKKKNFLNTSSTYIRVLKKNNSFNSKNFNMNKKSNNNNFKTYHSKKIFHPLSLTKDRKSISKEKEKKNTFYSNYKYGIKKNFLLSNYYKNKKLKKKNSKNLSVFINKNNNKNNIINLSNNFNLDKNKRIILCKKCNHSYDKSSNDNKLKEELNIKVNINNYNNYKINYLKKNNKTISEPNSSSINTKSTFSSDVQNEINKKNYKKSIEKYINKNSVIKNLENNCYIKYNIKKRRAISTEIKNNNNFDNKNNNNNIENNVKIINNNNINLPYYLGEIDVNKIIYKNPYKIRENINNYFPNKKIYINNNNYNNSYFKILCNKGINKFKIDFYKIKNIKGIYVDITLLDGNKKDFENISKTVYEILNY